MATITVTHAVDKMGREVAVIPDEVARLLTSHQDEGWREVAGVGWGCSREFPADHPVTIAAAQIQAQLDGKPHAAVVGESDWNPDTQWWRDYLGHRDLHPRPFDVQDGTARFSG